MKEVTEQHQETHIYTYAHTISSQEQNLFATTTKREGKTPFMFKMWRHNKGLGFREPRKAVRSCEGCAPTNDKGFCNPFQDPCCGNTK
jgi:hypothetical protein